MSNHNTIYSFIKNNSVGVVLIVLTVISLFLSSYYLTYFLMSAYLFSRIYFSEDINTKLLSIFFFAYYFIPLPNISSYRGTITFETLVLYTIMLLLATLPTFYKRNYSRKNKVEKKLLVNSLFEKAVTLHLLIVYLLLLYVLFKHGNIIVHQESRFALNPYIVYLIKSSIYIPLFYPFIVQNKKSNHGYVKYGILPLFPALFIGSRGVVVLILIAVGLIFIMRDYDTGKEYKVKNNIVWDKNKKLISIIASFILIIIHVFYYSRRIFSEKLLSNMEVVNKYFNSDSPAFLIVLPLYTSFRETVGIANIIISKGIENEIVQYPLFISELITVLPGHQPSPGKIIGNIIGRKLGGGLTPNILGGLYVDFGVYSVFACMLIVIFIKYLYEISKYNAVYKILYAITIAQFFHLFHRGFLKPEYFVAYIIVYLYVYIINKSLSKQSI